MGWPFGQIGPSRCTLEPLFLAGPGRNYRIINGYLRGYLIFVVQRRPRFWHLYRLGSTYHATPIRQKSTAICLHSTEKNRFRVGRSGPCFNDIFP